MLRFVRMCGLASTTALAVGCASTSFVSSWQAPVEGPIQFDNKRVAAIVVHADESTRRAGETALAREISSRGAQGVPSYTIIPGESAAPRRGEGHGLPLDRVARSPCTPGRPPLEVQARRGGRVGGGGRC